MNKPIRISMNDKLASSDDLKTVMETSIAGVIGPWRDRLTKREAFTLHGVATELGVSRALAAKAWNTLRWPNYLMRNNFVEHVNSIMGNKFVEHQRISAFTGVAFDALWHGKKSPALNP